MGSYQILIVDDDERVRNLVFSLSFKNGHTCEVANGGIKALEEMILLIRW